MANLLPWRSVAKKSVLVVVAGITLYLLFPSLAAVFGPLFFSHAYAALRPHDPGMIWVVGAGVYLIALPMMWGLRGKQAAPSGA